MVKSSQPRHPLATALATLLVLTSGGCSDDSVEVQSGAQAQLRVLGAQFTPARFPIDPAADAGTVAPTPLPDGGELRPPTIVSTSLSNLQAPAGISARTLHIITSETARTVAIGLEGDDSGYWLAPVGIESVEFAPNLEQSLTFELDPSFAVGSAKLVLAAFDAQGRIGAPRTQTLNVISDLPTAPLVVSLSWSSNADLDLLIVQPDGTTLTNKAGSGSTTGPILGKIDLDSNANCLIDGQRLENASYTAAAAGTYQVFVREASACGAQVTGWTVRVLRDGNEVASSTGASYAYETDVPNGGPSGRGRLALSFNLGG